MSADKQTHRTNRKPPSDFRRLGSRFMGGLLRSLFLINKPTRAGESGFVLPTTVLLLLVMTLTIGAMSFRTASRTQSTILAREQNVIDNVAAPAVDRAKAKLEYLFGRETRVPGTTTPSSDTLATLMLNVTNNALSITAIPGDPYTIPGETRIDINNDGTPDNAWSFPFDTNGDGTIGANEIIAYSVLMDDAVDLNAVPTPTRADDIKIEDTGTAANILKARNLVTRNGPINTNNTISNCGGARTPSQGWLTINNAALEKNFQITAFVSNGQNTERRANSAMELQQVRLSQQGNTWGAWFKYDLEVHPGPNFNWNGAIHTDGNLMATNNFRAHMISSHNSCLYTQGSSNITLNERDYNGDGVVNVAAAPIAGTRPDFQGQLIAGAPTYGNLNGRGTPGIHVFKGLNTQPTINNTIDLNNNNDSVQGTNFNDLLALAVDPVALFTQDVSQHRSTGPGQWQRAANWTTNLFNTGGRVTNLQQNPPFLDDFYRADDRYGPKPNYATTNWVQKTDNKLGEEIVGADALTNTTGGLDGYWERRAIVNGMRVIVGQRLELGDHLGWNSPAGAGTSALNTSTSGSSLDPLYPPIPRDTLRNKQRQRVTLRDNLAAVQGMVVYHYNSNNGQYPLACIANTAHPGTLQTLRASRTFSNYPTTGSVKTDFLRGQGTNGWEFSFPTVFDTDAKFGSALATDQPLGIALRNLAYFAGDPNGGSPSFRPRQDDTVHPFPHQAMWGDFSILRRIFDERLDATVAKAATTNRPAIPVWLSGTAAMADRYAALSPADKSSLHSASCTLGMLAYNLTSQQNEDKAVFSANFPNQGAANNVGKALVDSIGATNGGPRTGSPAKAACTATSLPQSLLYDWDCRNLVIDKEQIISSAAITTNQKAAAQAIGTLEQIERDRKFGFVSPSNTGFVDYVGKVGSTTYYFRLASECNPNDPTSKVAEAFNGIGLGLTDSKAALALMCSPAAPKYPSLHYVFPVKSHNQRSTTDLIPQPAAEEYIAQDYLSNALSTAGVNKDVAYKVVGDTGLIPGVEDSGDAGIGAIAFTPRASNASNWSLPRTPVAAGTLNPESMNIQMPNGSRLGLSLLDKVMFNGREEMAVRVLDVDMEKLTRNKNGADYWIASDRDPENGSFYAAREDAAREDAITRPASTSDWRTCDTFNELFDPLCLSRPSRTVASGGPVDPPLSRRVNANGSLGSLVGISIKPIDFAPDPDRRPHGFRLNAALNNNNGDLSDRNTRAGNLTFVTDNAAYIKGEFNPHTSNGTNTLEEFNQTLFDDAVAFEGPFYNNRTTKNDTNFANPAVDRWRVAEILADAVYVLSDNFVDGAVQEGFTWGRTAVSTNFQNTAGANSLTSFHNQQRPLDNNGNALAGSNNWYRIDGSRGSTGGDETLPVWIGRTGESAFFQNATNPARKLPDSEDNQFFELPVERNVNSLIRAATPQRTNATIISGIGPSRSGNSYGGLHNFPRFLENWAGNNLFIQGAFLQLNFNTSGTGLFDLDSWEPGDTPIDDEQIDYYSPPARRWGYDVALQFVSAGPIAQRFVSVGRPRSEHYRELPIEDPYVTNLRCSQRPSGGTRIFPGETCPAP